MTTLYIDSKKVSALYIDGKPVQLKVPQYLTIEPLSSATPDADKTSIMLRNSASTSLTGTFEAKLNDGAWTTVSWEDVSHGIDYNLVKACDAGKETISFGEKLQIRGLDKWNSNCSLKVTCEGGAKVSGKMAGSLTPEYAASTESYKLTSFFKGSTGLKDASGLDLGDITLAIGCYTNMFRDCSSLTQAPALPATTLASNCYNYMFNSCANITELHYPASVQNDSTFTGMTGSPWFGATNATVHYDL